MIVIAGNPFKFKKRSQLLIAVDTNRTLQFQKRSQYFIGVYNEPLSIVAMCVISFRG